MCRKVIVFLFFIVTGLGCNAQLKKKFTYNDGYAGLIKTVAIPSNISVGKFVNAQKYLPKGFVKNGTVDYTSFIQKALDENSKVILPDFPVLINEKGLSLKSNSVLFFQKQSKLILRPNSLPKYQMLDINGIQNVTICNPRLTGDRFKHLGDKGEWGMGVNITASQNITIYNPDIRNFWGDGIYINRLSSNQSQNIQIKGGLVDNNRRNAISIISGRNINISDIMLSNSNGTLPMAGIDIEPNNHGDLLEGINLTRVNTYNNGEYGMSVILIYMIGANKKNVQINIDSHNDYFSKSSFLIGGNKLSYPANIQPLGGKITIKNSTWHDSEKKLLMASDFKYIPKYEFSNLKITKKGAADGKATKEKISALKARGIAVK